MKIAEMTKGELAERLILSVLNTSDVKERILNFPSIDKGSFSLVVQLSLEKRIMRTDILPVLMSQMTF